MTKYLVLMCVTLEQESAIKDLFCSRGWTYSKQDLFLGPVEAKDPDLPTVKVREKGRSKKRISSTTDIPHAKKAKHGDNYSSSNVPASALNNYTGTQLTSTSVQLPSSAQSADRVQTSTTIETLGGISSIASGLSSVTVPVGPAHTYYVKEEDTEAIKDDDSMTLPVIYSVESLAQSSNTSFLPASIQNYIINTHAASPTVHDIPKVLGFTIGTHAIPTTVHEMLKVKSSAIAAPKLPELEKACVKIEAGDSYNDPMSKGCLGDKGDSLGDKGDNLGDKGDNLEARTTAGTSVAAAMDRDVSAVINEEQLVSKDDARSAKESPLVSPTVPRPKHTAEIIFHYPSQTKKRVLDGKPSYIRIARAIGDDRPKQLAWAVWDDPRIRKELEDCFCREISKECRELCKYSKDSLLQRVSATELQAFDFRELFDQWKTDSPLFIKVLAAIISQSLTIPDRYIPNIAYAGSILLRCRNPRRSAAAIIVGLFLDCGGTQFRTLEKVSSLGVCISAETVSFKKKEISQFNQDKKISFTAYKRTLKNIILAENTLKNSTEQSNDSQPSHADTSEQ